MLLPKDSSVEANSLNPWCAAQWSRLGEVSNRFPEEKNTILLHYLKITTERIKSHLLNISKESSLKPAGIPVTVSWLPLDGFNVSRLEY